MEDPTIEQPSPARRLTRSESNRMVAGVCGGLADYTGLDPVIFRVVLAVSALVGGIGVVAYVAAWLLIPEAGGRESVANKFIGRQSDLVTIALAVILAIVGLAFIGIMFDDDNDFGPPKGLLFLLILFGVGIWLWSRRGTPGRAPATMPLSSTTIVDTPVLVSTAAPAPPRPPRERSRLFLVTMSAVLLTIGGMLVIGVSDAGHVDVDVFLAVILLVVAGGLLLGAWRGRARMLIPVAFLLTMATATASIADVPLSGGAGERTWRPNTLALLEDEYRLGAGAAELDLRHLPEFSGTKEVDVSVGLGELVVWLPPGVDVEIDAHAGGGEVVILGQSADDRGLDVSKRATFDEPGNDRLVLDLRVGFGSLEVAR